MIVFNVLYIAPQGSYEIVMGSLFMAWPIIQIYYFDIRRQLTADWS